MRRFFLQKQCVPLKEVYLLRSGIGLFEKGASERLVFLVEVFVEVARLRIAHISMYSGQSAIPTWFRMRR